MTAEAFPASGLPRVNHRIPMLNPKTIWQEEELKAFDIRSRTALGDPPALDYLVEPKFRGLDVELLYKSGTLVTGSTKGDGYTGELVTANIKTILTVPLTLLKVQGGPPLPELLDVRGTVYMEKDAFESLNHQRKEKGLSVFADPLSTVADSLRQTDPRVTAKRPLNMFCHGIGQMKGMEMEVETQMALMTLIQQWGLRVNRPHLKVCQDVDEAISQCRLLGEMRNEFPFEIDGAMIKVNRLDFQFRLGGDSLGPRWAVAYRFGPGQGSP